MTTRDEAKVRTAREAIGRLAGDFWSIYADQIDLRIAPDHAHSYTTSRCEERLVVEASTAANLVAGLTSYLETHGYGHFGRNGAWSRVPHSLELPGAAVHGDSRCRYRYVNNFTVAGYTSPYWQWTDWEREIDIWASAGINLALVTTGAEALWLDLLMRFGYSEHEALSWIALPGHQPWQWLGNLTGNGDGTSRELVEKRAEMGARILDRLDELGIEAALPGFCGNVPEDFAQRNPGCDIKSQGQWRGFDRPAWLDPRSDAFAAAAAAYYESQKQRFGLRRCQATDILHEGGNDDYPLGVAASAITQAMRQHHPDYLWITQAWQNNPRDAVLSSIDTSHVLILDLKGTQWHRRDWHGAAWAWSILPNYGGRLGLFGALPAVADFPALVDNSETEDLRGTAYMAEGTDTNPVLWSMFADASWSAAPIDVTGWVADYAKRRYGQDHPRARQAWLGLLSTVYRSQHGMPGGADSILTAVPSLDAAASSPAAPHYLPYPAEALEVAWRDLLAARNALGDVDAFHHDLVDVTRQVFSNRARTLLPLLKTAYASADARRFSSLRYQFLELFEVLEPVLATRAEFMLGTWIEKARTLASTSEEADTLEREARTLVTNWGTTREQHDWLRGYANREWAGLISTLYRPRWEAYLDSLAVSLDSGQPAETIDFFAFTKRWIDELRPVAASPIGDPIAAARAAHHALPYFEGLP